MSKSFKDMHKDKQVTEHFRIVEIEKGRTVKREFRADNSYKDVPVEVPEFDDVPF